MSFNFTLDSLNSKYLFQLTEDNILHWKSLKDSVANDKGWMVLKKEVLIYYVIIDNNIIHLVYANRAGELGYEIYNNGHWAHKTIKAFDNRTIDFNQLELKLIDSKLNIFLSYSNLINSNIYIISHFIYGEILENVHNVIRYIPYRKEDLFTVDTDSHGTIHLLYNTSINSNSYIYHFFYSPYTKTWSNNPKQMSTSNKTSVHPYIFSDTMNNTHSIWLEKVGTNYQIVYYRMSPTGKDKYKWSEIKLPPFLAKGNQYLIIEESHILKIVSDNESQSNYLDSSDYGLNWSVKVHKDPIAPMAINILDEQILQIEEKELIEDEIEEVVVEEIIESNKTINREIEILENQTLILNYLIEIKDSLDEKNNTSFISRFKNIFIK